MTIETISLADKLGAIDDRWNPKIVAELNGQHVKLAKLEGEFVWHHHEDEDELFLVVEGVLSIELRDKTLELAAGEMVVVPRGVEHRPVVPLGVCSVLLFEPASTVNTGNVEDDPRRVSTLERF